MWCLLTGSVVMCLVYRYRKKKVGVVCTVVKGMLPDVLLYGVAQLRLHVLFRAILV